MDIPETPKAQRDDTAPQPNSGAPSSIIQPEGAKTNPPEPELSRFLYRAASISFRIGGSTLSNSTPFGFLACSSSTVCRSVHSAGACCPAWI